MRIKDISEISQSEIRNNDNFYLLAGDGYEVGKIPANSFVTKEEFHSTFDDLMERINNVQINSFVVEWNKGKKRIVDAINKFGIKAYYTDSFDELADKIRAIPFKVNNEGNALPWTYNGAQDWDLLNELHTHQELEYPYLYGVLLDASYDEVKLSGADAYYTSDGFFYRNSTTHTFEDDGKITRYIIYYFKDPEYLVTQQFESTIEMVCYNGRPRIVFNDQYKYISRLISYTNEEYEVNAGDLNITNNPPCFVEIILNGITVANANTTIGNRNDYYKKVSLPKLQKCYGTSFLYSFNINYFGFKKLIEIDSTNSSFTHYLRNVKKVNMHNVSKFKSNQNYQYFISCDNLNGYLEKIEFPNLESIENGTLVGQFSILKNISCPKLKFTNYNTRLVGNCSKIEIDDLKEICLNLDEINCTIMYNDSTKTSLIWPDWLPEIYGGYTFDTFPNVTYLDVSNLIKINRGVPLINFGRIKEIEFTNLESIDGGGLLSTFNVVEKISCPKLEKIYFTETNPYNGIINAAYKLKEVNFPKLKYLFKGELLVNCRSLTEITFPELEYTQQSGFNAILSQGIRANKITVNLPKLKDTNNQTLYIVHLPRPYVDPDLPESEIMYYEEGKPDSYVIVNLGAPIDGYINLTGNNVDNYGKPAYDFVRELHIQPGFKSHLYIGSFSQLTHDNLVEILENLGDNSDSYSKRVTLGSINLAKLSDEEKKIAIDKNYTLA